MYRVKVPATTANIGPGFDTLGIALNLYNTFEIEISDKTQVISPDSLSLPLSKNLVYHTIESLLKACNRDLCYKLTIVKCHVPLSRGLGSSATAIVAGIYLANYLMDFPYSTQDILNLANKLEGHPDNTSPCILGNMVLSVEEEGNVIPLTIDFPEDIVFKTFSPNFEQSTEESRCALPKEYSIDDIKFNLSRLPLLLHSIERRDYSLIKVAIQDRLHQPYRIHNIDESHQILKVLKEPFCLGYFLSGSGPTIIGLVKEKDLENINASYKAIEHLLTHQWHVQDLYVCKTGVVTEEIS